MGVTPNTFVKNLITPSVYNSILKKSVREKLATILRTLDKVTTTHAENLNSLIREFYLSETFKQRASIFYELIVLTILDTIVENCVEGYYSVLDTEVLDDITYSFVGDLQEEGLDNSCIKEFLIKMIKTLNDDKGLNSLLKEYKDKKCGRPQMPQGQPIDLPKVMTP